MEKILDIVELIAYEKGLESSVVIELIKECMINVAQETLSENANFCVQIDEKERNLKLFQKIIVCKEDEEESCNHIPLSKAKEINPDLNVGDELNYEISLEDMSRNTINILFKNLEFKLQKMIEDQLFERLKSKVGKIVSGQVVRIDDEENTYVEIGEVRGILSMRNRIKGEKFKIGDTILSLLKNIRFSKNGMLIELSRTSPQFVVQLLHLEVPEIKDGEITIHKCARIPGDRAKIALSSLNPRIDPIGSTVGTKGVRINAISRELNGENIDCVEFNENPEIFIAKALSPAMISNVKILKDTEKPQAIITLTNDQKSKAIGKNGVNIRLASMLTGYDLQINEVGMQDLLEAQNQPQAEQRKVGLDALESLFKN
ncbi:transcription termination factor NusA [Helicobacter enhydrae]|uniref:Transcription termination/antitermination protein NusA n=1 Tax=Helicobacter enhydrae TaxID=222136 RepID=A0A1B1U655_9HELI|nr:transcription termination factor NusA [Helicobacter enhydrae]ANV98182.1 transcription termination factor NusA [Helicobacter enhydrae]